MLPNGAALGETVLAAMKLGVVLVPTTTQTAPPTGGPDGARRGQHLVTDAEGLAKFRDVPGRFTRFVDGAETEGSVSLSAADAEASDVQHLRTVEPGRRGLRLALRTVRCPAHAGDGGALRRDHVLRAAHGVAHARV
jgi:hypothetical protein